MTMPINNGAPRRVGAPFGNRNAWKHGQRSAHAIAARKRLAALTRDMRTVRTATMEALTPAPSPPPKDTAPPCSRCGTVERPRSWVQSRFRSTQWLCVVCAELHTTR